MSDDEQKVRVIAVQSAVADFCRGKTTRAVAQKALERAGCKSDAATKLLDAAVANLTGVMA